MKIVIVGGVAGGASAAARLRRLDENAEIIMLEKGEFVSFANCGLPYHIGGDIKERDELLIASPPYFRDTFNIDVRVGHEALEIDRESHRLRVRDNVSGRDYWEIYDKLILSQGATPVRPDLPGIDHPRVFTLRNIPDMDAIKSLVDAGAKSAVIVGSNFIGLETVEALRNRCLVVDLVEIENQVRPVLDPELAIDLEQQLKKRGVRLHLGTSAQSFSDADGRVEVTLAGGRSIVADFALVAIGVRPDTAMAQAAGLEIGVLGAVKVDQHMLTSDPDIYAAGDMVEVTDTVTGELRNMPLAGPANRQGRIAADHICGRPSAYTTTQGTAIAKVFDMTAASTGASEKTLKRLGRPYRKLHLHPFGHASYYPGTSHMQIKVLFDPADGRLLGTQIVGRDGVDKRIDIFAVAVRTGMTVYDLEHLELAYAPPYGSAKDPVNMAGFVGTNMMEGIIDLWYPEDFPEKTSGGTILDVRTSFEYKDGHIPGARHLPVHQLRSRMHELDKLKDAPVFVYCLSGIRSYIASRMLMQSGFGQVYNLSGGIKTFQCCQPGSPLKAGRKG
jgi:NADPH-dependent 2,4-dienoyl-CoA reductase/sulfur reductase-like enzyme/rhodanese-related sulfurtransferase